MTGFDCSECDRDFSIASSGMFYILLVDISDMCPAMLYTPSIGSTLGELLEHDGRSTILLSEKTS